MDFQAAWQHFHGDHQPVGHLLETYAGWNLTRFHLLPDGRANAHDNDELRYLLARYNKIAIETLGEGEPCFMMILQTVNQNASQTARLNRLKKRHQLDFAMSFHNASDKFAYAAYAGLSAWFNQRFNRELLHIYQHRLWDVLWMNARTGATFRPYDAGADVSQPTPQALMELISRHYNWLPGDGSGFLRLDPAQMSSTRFEVTTSCAEAIRKAVGGR